LHQSLARRGGENEWAHINSSRRARQKERHSGERGRGLLAGLFLPSIRRKKEKEIRGDRLEKSQNTRKTMERAIDERLEQSSLNSQGEKKKEGEK